MSKAVTPPTPEHAEPGWSGQVLDGRFRLNAPLGRGAMGVVYRAEQLMAEGHPCAVKIMEPRRRTRVSEARFAREVRVLERIQSPWIVRCLGAGEAAPGRPYVAMALLDGHTLAERQASGDPFSGHEALWFADGVLMGLAEAHRHQIVHRDLKAANVMLVTDERSTEAVILDFGLAKELEPQVKGPITGRGDLLGTPSWMAPEQFVEGHPVDARADLYAAGCLLYLMLAGRPPFRRDDPVPEKITGLPPVARVAWQHLHREPVRPEGLSDDLWQVLSVLLAKRPESRFQTAAAAVRALRSTTEGKRWLSNRPTPPRPPSEQATRPVKLADRALLRPPAPLTTPRSLIEPPQASESGFADGSTLDDNARFEDKRTFSLTGQTLPEPSRTPPLTEARTAVLDRPDLPEDLLEVDPLAQTETGQLSPGRRTAEQVSASGGSSEEPATPARVTEPTPQAASRRWAPLVLAAASASALAIGGLWWFQV